MRWPLRNQILVPLVAAQLLVVTGVCAVATWWSLANVQQAVLRRLDELSRTLATATYPLNDSVLLQLRGLSGAEFLLLHESGELRASTLPDVELPSPGEIELAGLGKVSRQVIQSREYLVTSVAAGGPSRGMRVQILYPGHLIQAARADAIKAPLALGGLTLLLSLAAMIQVSRRIGRRMQAIEQQVARVAAGDFQAIPLPRRDDELRDLSASVNQMAGDLERLTGEIRETERARLLKQLAGGIAHQLRNAITGARLAVQLHRRRCSAEDEGSLDVALRQLALIEEQIRGLVALIRDEHRVQLAANLQLLLDEVATLVRPICEHRHIRLETQFDIGEFPIRDRDQMRAALLNLALNAIEATGSGGLVELAASQREQLARIEIRDDGPGVAPQLADDAFLPFRTTKSDGMGLGLALVRQAAADHGGEIVYTRENGKTVFRLTCRAALRSAASLAASPVPPLTEPAR